MAYLIDGKAISKQIKDELREEVTLLKEKGFLPCLAVIQVGKDPASCVYVNNKKKACEYIGIDSLSYQEGAKPAKWFCDGSMEYEMTDGERSERGTRSYKRLYL